MLTTSKMKTSLQLHASVESKTMFRPTPWCPSTSFVFAVDVSNGCMAKEKKEFVVAFWQTSVFGCHSPNVLMSIFYGRISWILVGLEPWCIGLLPSSDLVRPESPKSICRHMAFGVLIPGPPKLAHDSIGQLDPAASCFWNDFGDHEDLWK